MGRRHRPLDKRAIARRKAQGFGEGNGRYYKPWHIVQRTSSRGVSWRLPGWTDDRIVHLLSGLEKKYRLILDWTLTIVGAQEQKDLPLEETVLIAQELGIEHPRDRVTGCLVPLSTDMVVTVRVGDRDVQFARTVKYVKDLSDLRVIEKFDIEREYYRRRGINWGIVTERNIPEILVRNIRWIYTFRTIRFYDTLRQPHVHRIGRLLTRLVETTNAPLRDVAAECDDILGFQQGTSLSVARHLIATRQWIVDMMAPIDPAKRLVLQAVALQAATGEDTSARRAE